MQMFRLSRYSTRFNYIPVRNYCTKHTPNVFNQMAFEMVKLKNQSDKLIEMGKTTRNKTIIQNMRCIKDNKHALLQNIEAIDKGVRELCILLDKFEIRVVREGVNAIEKKNWDKFIDALIETGNRINNTDEIIDDCVFYAIEVKIDKNLINAAKSTLQDNSKVLYALIDKTKEIVPRVNSGSRKAVDELVDSLHIDNSEDNTPVIIGTVICTFYLFGIILSI